MNLSVLEKRSNDFASNNGFLRPATWALWYDVMTYPWLDIACIAVRGVL